MRNWNAAWPAVVVESIGTQAGGFHYVAWQENFEAKGSDDCRNGSDAELLGTSERASVHHILDDDLGRRTGLSPHYVDYLFAKRASCAEYFHLALAVHSTLHIQIVNNGQSMPARRFPPPWSVEELDACFLSCATVTASNSPMSISRMSRSVDRRPNYWSGTRRDGLPSTLRN